MGHTGAVPAHDAPQLPETDIPAEPGRRYTSCRACKHRLRDDESRRTGYGPCCRRKLFPPRDPRVRRPGAFVIDQDALPGI